MEELSNSIRSALNRPRLNTFADMNVPHYEATITRIRSELRRAKTSHNNHVPPHTEIYSVTAGLLYPVHRCTSKKMWKEKGNWSGIVLHTQRIKGECEYSLPSPTDFGPHKWKLWQKTNIHRRYHHSKSIRHMKHMLQTDVDCYSTYFMLIPPEKSVGLQWSSQLQNTCDEAAEVKGDICFLSILLWKHGNTALNATCWHLKELLCYLNQMVWVYVSK